jgi:tyrosine-specific transport protein
MINITISIALLVTGNLIGAGILGIPITGGLAGALPSIITMAVFMIAMFYTAVVLADEAIVTGDEAFNYPSLYAKYLGPIGKWVATLANMLILYGLLIAYLAGGASVITQFFCLSPANKTVLPIFFLIMTLLTIMGIELIKKCNVFLIVLLWSSFIVISIIGLRYMVPTHFSNINLSMVPLSAPIILTAFHFHNIIPNISQNAGWNKKIIYSAMLIGMIIGFILNAMWLIIGIGVLPFSQGADSISYSYAHNITSITPMMKIIENPAFLIFALTFTIVAIITSYFANGLGLMGFSKDLVENYFKNRNKLLQIAITFLPPLIISMINPDIFLKAIDIVGGIGIVVLFGILPSVISVINPRRSFLFKAFSVIMLVLFTSVFLYQAGIKLDIIHMKIPYTILSSQPPNKLNVVKVMRTKKPKLDSKYPAASMANWSMPKKAMNS